jgi:FKBP-type peptidyl-prolyl cis-trans isomerase SlyD
MQIAKDFVVSIEYTLTDDDGNVIDQSAGNGPLSYVHGHDQIVPGLEKALTGKRVGDKLSVSVPPEEGYGAYDEELVFEVPRSELPPSIQPVKGMDLSMSGPDGNPVPVTIIKVKLNSVTLDGNHPLAGKTLHFAVDVSGVRKATPEDLMKNDCCSTGTCTASGNA